MEAAPVQAQAQATIRTTATRTTTVSRTTRTATTTTVSRTTRTAITTTVSRTTRTETTTTVSRPRRDLVSAFYVGGRLFAAFCRKNNEQNLYSSALNIAKAGPRVLASNGNFWVLFPKNFFVSFTCCDTVGTN